MSGHETRFYFVSHDDTDNHMNYDLLVEAKSHEEAIKLWRDYYDDDDDPDAPEMPLQPEQVFLVPPLTGTVRAVPWHGSAVDLAMQSIPLNHYSRED